MVDISRYTEMEVEHGHDTANQIAHPNEGHIQADVINDFNDHVVKQMGDIKEQALQ